MKKKHRNQKQQIQPINDINLKILQWGIFVLIFTPLIFFSNILGTFHFSKVLFFRSIVEVLFVFYVLLAIKKPEYRLKWNALTISVSVFVGVYILAGIFGVNPYRSFWGTIERMEGIFTFIHYWLFFIMLVSVFKAKQDWQKLLKISLLAGLLSILYAYGQYFNLNSFVGWQRVRLTSTMGNAALFAGYLIFILFLAILFLFKREVLKKEKIFYGAILILGVPALLLTAVRGSIISFIGGLVLLAILSLFTSTPKLERHGYEPMVRGFNYGNNRMIKRGALAILIFLILLVGFVWIDRSQPWVQGNQYLQRITDISWQTKTIQTRFWTWNSAWQGWKERFWLGWGPENFNVLFAKYLDSRHYTGASSEIVWDRAHNDFLNTGATTGIVGLAAYLSIFAVLAYYLVRIFISRPADRMAAAILAVMIVVHIGHNFFLFDTINSYLMFFVVLGYISFLFGHFEGQPQGNTTGKLIHGSLFRHRNTVLALVIFLVVFSLYKTTFLPIKANRATAKAIVYGSDAKYYRQSFDNFHQALSYNTSIGKYEIRNRLARVALTVFTKGKSLQQLGLKKEDILFALDEVKKNTQTDPDDPIPYLYISRINLSLAVADQSEKEIRLKESEKALILAMKLSKNNSYIYFELGQVRTYQNKMDEAINFFNQGIKLNSELNLGYWYKGMTFLWMGNFSEGENYINMAIARGYQKSASDIDKMIKVYVNAKNYGKVIELYQESIKLDPKNPQFYASLAAAYEENGEIEKAIETAQKAGEISPEYKQESEGYIEMLKGKLKK